MAANAHPLVLQRLVLSGHGPLCGHGVAQWNLLVALFASVRELWSFFLPSGVAIAYTKEFRPSSDAHHVTVAWERSRHGQGRHGVRGPGPPSQVWHRWVMCSFGSSSTALREVHWGVPRPSLRGKKLILTQVLARLLCDCCCFPSSSTLLPPSSFSLSLSLTSLSHLTIHIHAHIYIQTTVLYLALQHSLPHCPIVVCRCSPPGARIHTHLDAFSIGRLLLSGLPLRYSSCNLLTLLLGSSH